MSAEPATALLAVLGLLLAFTVSMTVERFETRRLLVTEEADAIDTARLRLRLLPEAAQVASRPLFDRYLDSRIRWGNASGDDASQHRLSQEAQQQQEQLWRVAVGVGATAPTPVFALYESALNQMFDLAAARGDARANGIPQSVLVVVSLMAIAANALFAGSLGSHGRRRRFDLHLLAFSTWLTIALVVDLDRPRGGWVEISQEPLIRLQDAAPEVLQDPSVAPR